MARLKRQTSSRNFLKWRIFYRRRAEAKAKRAEAQRERDIKHPTQDQYYMAQIAKWVYAVVQREVKPIEDFLIPFTREEPDTTPPMTREERIAEADKNAKLIMFARLGGTPANFEGFKE